MSSKNNLIKRLKSLKIREGARYWEALRDLPISQTITSASKEQVMSLAMSYDDVYSVAEHLANKSADAPRGSSYSKYYTGMIIHQINSAVMLALPKKGDYLLKNSDNMSLKCFIFDNGLYSSVKMIDYLAENSEGDIQIKAASVCSVSQLRKLNKRKKLDKAVRKIIYDRLGPVECLDQMIDDKYAQNRESGYRWAPYGYKKLEEKAMTEIARGPTSILIRKLSVEFMPLMLANRNVLKNKWIAKMIEERMNSGE